MIELPPLSKLWLPSPAIVRPADDLVRARPLSAMPLFATFAAAAAPGRKGGQGAELLLVLFASWATNANATHTYPAGWVKLAQWQSSVAHGSGGRVQLSAGFRFRTGSEGATIAVSKSASNPSSYAAYRIAGVRSGAAPESGTVASAESTNLNPPLLTPSWGADNTLWIAFGGHEGGNSAVVAPTDYTGLIDQEAGADASGIVSAHRQLNASSENPGTFTSSNQRWAAQTIAIRPDTVFPAVTGSGSGSVGASSSHTVTLPG